MKLRGDPLQSLGTANTVGMPLKFAGPSPTGSYHGGQDSLNLRSMECTDIHAVRAWTTGVLSVDFAVKPPKFIRDYLDYRKATRKYTLRVYVPSFVARYLVSCEVTGKARFQTIWCCRYQRLVRRPTDEFFSLAERIRISHQMKFVRGQLQKFRERENLVHEGSKSAPLFEAEQSDSGGSQDSGGV